MRVMPGGEFMSSRVLLVTRLGSSLGVSGVHGNLSVADIRHADAVESAITDIHQLDQRVVLTGSVNDTDDLHAIAARAKIRVRGLRTAVEPLPGNPLALAVISSLADDSAGNAAWLHATLDDLRDRAWSATWLTKLSQLTQPNPSMWQHVRSWIPGAAFLAEQTPTESVRLASHEPLTVNTPRPGTALLHSPSDSWVIEAVRTALGSSTSSPISPVRDLVDTYGTAHAVELVAIPEDFGDRASARARHAVDCNACGAIHARASCPYCHMTTRTFQGVPE